MHHYLKDISGTVYCYKHLDDFSLDVSILLRGDIRKKVKVLFSFSNHCYSSRIDDSEFFGLSSSQRKNIIIEGDRKRKFDAERYYLSKNLKTVITRVVNNDEMVSKTHHENFFKVERSSVNQRGDYYIFMKPKKIKEANRPTYIKVIVESAYIRDDSSHPVPKVKSCKNISEVLGGVW